MQSPRDEQAPASAPELDRKRRSFLRFTAGGLAGGFVAAQLTHGQDSTPDGEPMPLRAPSFADAHEARPLPFEPTRLNGLSERLIESHWTNNYGGSVRALNEIKRRLADALTDPDLPAFVYNDLKREHLMRTGSVVLHELYFDNLGGNGRADAAVRDIIASAFDTFDRWENEFRRIAAGLGGGSGWVVLGYNRHFGTLENYWLADHMHNPATTEPLLVIDMYEHSYHMDYGAATARYIDAFFANVNWETVLARVEGLR